MRWLASCLVLAGLAVVAAGCGASRSRVVSNGIGPLPTQISAVRSGNHFGPGPLAPSGDWAGGSESGLVGDGGDSSQGTSLGCIDGRRYSYAFGLRNRARVPVRLTAAQAPNRAPIVRLVAVQLRLSPPQPKHRSMNNLGQLNDLVYRHWSAAPQRPVTIPPGRIVTVQVNYLMRNCPAPDLEPSALLVPGRLTTRFRMDGRSGVERFGLPENRFFVKPGPVRRTCEPVAGSARLTTSNFSCALAEKVAPRCRKMQNEGWLGCQLGGTFWVCGSFAGAGSPLLETCYLPHDKARWFSVVWTAPGLGLWGAIRDRPANAGWRVLDKSRVTEGRCTLRDGGKTLVYESAALTLGRGDEITGMPMTAHVRFLIHGYHGPGSYWARQALNVVVPRASYAATAGRIRIARAAGGTLAGLAFASLHPDHGQEGASLNGTWSCTIRG